jgi:hypothetical protein
MELNGGFMIFAIYKLTEIAVDISAVLLEAMSPEQTDIADLVSLC